MSSADEARAFARGFLCVELAEVLANPLSRPTGWLILVGSLANALAIGSVLALFAPIITSAVLSVLVGVALTVGVYALTAYVLEVRSFARAPFAWLIDTGSGRAGGYAISDAKHRLTLYSVWASPRGKGGGTQLMRAVLADTADTHPDLALVAANRRSEAFYRRFGFQPQRRELFGRRMILARAGSRFD